ncbi:MAG: hypothetical protein J07AB43_13250 [Candidatus Nanosalina sp. J07AB43]|jgi:hypothetical protein|nr:MAG: hypothetical protein J07AB43_13250 [Candidatus Nanosalina sp. J07AB43]
MQKIDNSIEDVGEKLKDLKKLDLLNYDQHTHQYRLTEEGKGKIRNQALEQVTK